MYSRAISGQLAAARLDTPVCMLAGPRQAGKSTLARLAAQTPPGKPIRFANYLTSATITRYLTLDDANTLEAARSDPQGLVEQYRSKDWLVLDEVQRAPDLLRAIKREVDLDRRPGRFLLTGSANVLTLPKVSESLAGRIEILRMWPLSQSEIESSKQDFLRAIFGKEALSWTNRETRDQLLQRLLKGGYPEVISRQTADRRNAWFGSYLATVVQREIKSISAIEDETAIVRILRTLASRSGGPRNFQSLAGDTGISVSTITRHVALLLATFLIVELPAWSRNIDARLVRAPKLLITDSGLYAHLLNLTGRDSQTGFLLETFVGTELLKLISFAPSGQYNLMHFRTRRAQEVDFVVEDSRRRIVGIEVKAATSVTDDDFAGLRELAKIADRDFARGIVLYSGERTYPHGDKLWAVPISALWEPREA